MTFESESAATNQMRTILDSASVQVFVLDWQYRYVSFNRLHADTMLSTWGISIAVGMDMVHDVIRDDQHRANVKTHLDRALAGANFVVRDDHGETELNRRFYDDHYSPIRTTPQEVTGVVVFAMDVTERVRLSEDHLRLERKVQQSRMLDRLEVLASGIAHDINNLVVRVALSADQVRAQIGPDHPANEPLATIAEAVKQAADLTQQLRAISGGNWASPEIVDLNGLVAQASDLARVYLGRETELIIRPYPEPLFVQADPTQIRQVITNLLINAKEASSGGISIVKIETCMLHVDALVEADACIPEQVPSGNYAVFSLQDNGSGMNSFQLTHVFDIAFSSKGPGRGFGLSAAQAIIRQHAGFIAVDSREGVGTSFRVGLRIIAPASETQ